MLFMLKPLPTTLTIFAIILTIAFPPLLLVPAGFLVAFLVRKRRAHTDPQAVAWRAQQEWFNQNR